MDPMKGDNEMNFWSKLWEGAVALVEMCVQKGQVGFLLKQGEYYTQILHTVVAIMTTL